TANIQGPGTRSRSSQILQVETKASFQRFSKTGSVRSTLRTLFALLRSMLFLVLKNHSSWISSSQESQTQIKSRLSSVSSVNRRCAQVFTRSSQHFFPSAAGDLPRILASLSRSSPIHI